MTMKGHVLSLYRKALRQVARISRDNKTGSMSEVLEKVRQEFEQRKGIDRRNFSRIEYLLRKGHKQVDMLNSDSVKSLSLRK